MKKGFQGVGGVSLSESERNSTSYYELSKCAEKTRATLEEELRKASSFTVFTYKPDDPPMFEKPLEPPVGLDSSFEEVWEWVQDESVRRIGIYGMGGVGKTTLLKNIHNEILRRQDKYDVVAWIVVSRPTDPTKIQKAIWEKLNLDRSEFDRTSESDRTGKIYSIMKRKSFLLFLDDIWEKIDLLNLGIPYRGHEWKSKIIFTTRSEEVCGQMQAERTKKIDCLPPDKALELFREKVGEETWTAHVEIPRLAECLVKECAYLPLALITVGAAMASRKDPDKWRRAIEYLQNRPSGFARMAERVLSVLEFSYEALPNETQKKCFLYCSTFPEDFVYHMDELIDLWMGEGFLSECDGSHEARNLGINIIEHLIDVCLLEEVDNSIFGETTFKMHDVVRDMALWLVSEHGQKKNKIVCLEKQRSFEPKEFMKWTNAETIFLQIRHQEMENFPVTPTAFSSLSTLIKRDTSVKTFPKGFFSSMPLLRVLDLSLNSHLEELPEDIGALVNLRYLNLWWTQITKLPVELKTLTKLVFLLLDDRCGVPKGLVPSLPFLRVFSWVMGKWGNPINEGEELNVIEELNGMNNQIDDVCLGLHFAASVQELLTDCPHLQRCLRELDLGRCVGLRSLIIPKPSLRRMEHLRVLWVLECEFEEISITVVQLLV
ncbi:probable disease resistance protein At5g63020 [Punica granatum]|uniref:Probable disease resistance protein At5g63020 n=1 Tax=Punica granatum TaxID=22663 RepID=A0A6P8BQS7_PUNGR|nr:probable disease resistance protein At5g63020 [Punica granatum]